MNTRSSKSGQKEIFEMKRAPITMLVAEDAPQMMQLIGGPVDMSAEQDTKDPYADCSDTV